MKSITIKRKKGRNNKKGLSPIIATVLLILLTLVLASLIFLWARGFISEQIEKFGTPLENLCASTRFNVKVSPGGSGDRLDIVNLGNVNIFQFDVRMNKGGEGKVTTFKFPVNAGEAVSGDIYLQMGDGSRPDTLEIFPALIGQIKGKNIGNNKIVTCIKNGETLSLGPST